MTLRPDTERFVNELEKYANRSMKYKEEIGILLDQSTASGKREVFDDIIFFAKFIAKSQDLMRRIGPENEGYGKLASEFQSAIEKTTSLMRTVVKEGPEEVKERFVEGFFRMDEESFSSLMVFVRELAWVKNWLVDGRPVP
ncbi:MAG: hypothetical protein HBSIN02_16160 [Bacteroidia bacterium]|nr:MAG: hypothetical protein HBSIN02_16160 [Bacteroidia bacterium]